MRLFWYCIWVAITAVEIGLAAWSHSASFLWIGSVGGLMVAFNLQRHARLAARKIAESAA